MIKLPTLRIRIYSSLAALVLITVIGGLVMVWYTYRMEKLLNSIDQGMSRYQAAEALELALVNQKGYLTYYLLDHDKNWLSKMGQSQQVFQARIGEAYARTENKAQEEFIRGLETEYLEYIKTKDRVIDLYQTNKVQAGADLHKEVRAGFFRMSVYCDQYKNQYIRELAGIREKSRSEAGKLRIIAAAAVIGVLILAVLLALVVTGNILIPLRRLAREADPRAGQDKNDDEVTVLDRSLRGLIEDVDQTHKELARSREYMLQAEKMAMVGKLAAGTAHSIRNPLTSVKMRIFSLGRTLDLDMEQKEDFDVITEEIKHIDRILRNFLEFSRPPKLKKQKVSPSDMIDQVLQLLKHRFDSYSVKVRVNRTNRLPETPIDPELIKEVVINILENACQAMDGGMIEINEIAHDPDDRGNMLEIWIADSGSGIPAAIQDKIFEPFFTTKEEGSGLGLSIALRIVKEHGGRLGLISQEGKGATFIISLPMEDKPSEYDSNH